MDEGILDWRRWTAVGVVGIVLLVLLAGGVIASQRQPITNPVHQPPPIVGWSVGATAIVKAQTNAADAAGPAAVHGTSCVMAAGTRGEIIEIGGPMDEPRRYVKLRTDGCTGWLAVGSIRKATK